MPDLSDYESQLKKNFKSIHPSTPHPTQRNTHIIKGLLTATHVFNWHDAVHKLLQPPYDRPFSVVKQTENYFTININSRKDTISIDRLKPTYLDTDHPHPTQQTALPTTQPPFKPLTLDDMSSFPNASHHTCCKTLGGSGVLN